ncbi:uncharacterized protein LOC141619611 [Silene latifolia]|uniref:uncharacterized protein LOC141619611 n=1 Tax=Silene latifolia TaxID=37657 RepID=UPI003D78A0E8
MLILGGVPEETKQDILKISGFSERSLPFKYLGMPIQTTRLKKQDSECLVENICARIHSYGARKFSYAGRLVLVKAVLSSMFVLPKGIIAKIEAVCRNFLWDNSTDYRRVPLVAWTTVCKPKEEGGLGIKDQELCNQAMVGRLVNWVAEKRNSIRHAGNTPTGCYEWLKGAGTIVQWFRAVWNDWVVPKHQFMGWLYAHGALRTNDELLMYGLDIDVNCYLCGQAAECMDHVFFGCRYSKQMINWLNQLTALILPDQHILEWCVDRQGSKLQKGVQAAVGMGAIYHIWHQRNCSKNDCVLMVPKRVAEQIVAEIRLRIRRRDENEMTIGDRDWLKNMKFL